MDIREAFENWDGKTTSDLRDVVDAFHPDLINDLLDACRSDDEVTARAASWVFKALLGKGVRLPFPTNLLADELHWEVALHLLQSFQFTTVDCPPEVVNKYLTNRRPMLRAWGLSGTYLRPLEGNQPL